MNVIDCRRLPISVASFTILFVLCWPLYKYIFDVDSIGYAAVAQHYVNGNFRLAVNGFWNPLHSWLVVPFLKMGITVEYAFKITCGLISIGSLAVLESLLHKFELTERTKTLIQLTAVPLFLHYAYYELAADVLFVLIMLLYFNLYKSALFFTSITRNVFAGLLGALLYFSKSYGFPFFLFHFTVIHLLLNKEKKKTIVPYLAGIISFFVITFPWLIALHWKYGEWMIAFGKYNAHWNFSDKPLPGPVIHPPPYEGSAAVWEDPWHVRSNNLENVPLLKILFHQLRTIVFNTQQLLKCFHELSFLAPAILVLTAVFIFAKKNDNSLFLLIAMLTLPAGYLLLHVETRFIWVLSFIFLIAGAGYVERLLSKLQPVRWLGNLLWLIFFCSFLLYPIDKLKDAAFTQKELYTAAQILKQQNITGSFTSNTMVGECMVIAWHGKMSYYRIVKPTSSSDELLTEINKIGIRHYFYYYSSQLEKELFLSGKIARTAVHLIEPMPGLVVASFY